MTIVSHKQKFIFVRPRKVGGTSLTIALSEVVGRDDIVFPMPRQDPELAYVAGIDIDQYDTVMPQNTDAFFATDTPHILPSVIRAKIGAMQWNSYFKFTVVRNPWDWFVSFYCWQLLRNWPTFIVDRHRDLPDLIRARKLFLDGAEKESLEFGLRQGLFEDKVAKMQKFYFINARQYADYYLRFEHLQADYERLCGRLQIAAKPLVRAKGAVRGDRPYQTMYSDYARRYIGKRYRRVIRAFGYRFDS